MTEIGKYLKTLRITYGDSLREMANKLDISPAYLSSIENGKRNVPNDLFESLCNAYPLDNQKKTKLKDAIYASNSNYRVDLSSLGDKTRQVILSITEGNLVDDVIDKLCEVVENNTNKNENESGVKNEKN